MGENYSPSVAFVTFQTSYLEITDINTEEQMSSDDFKMSPLRGVYHMLRQSFISFSVSRSLTCGRCIRSAAGISSQLEIASVSSMKISLDKADASSLPRPMWNELLKHPTYSCNKQTQNQPSIALDFFEEEHEEKLLLYQNKKGIVSYSCHVYPCHCWYSTSLWGGGPVTWSGMLVLF